MSAATLALSTLDTTHLGTAKSSQTNVIHGEDEENQEEKDDALEDPLKLGTKVKAISVLAGGEGESAIPEDKKVGTHSACYVNCNFH